MLIAIICLFTGFILGFFTTSPMPSSIALDSDRKNDQ